ncbi:MAG TPA: hypothetical protein EYP73_07730, partial [Acidimicrobiia bacterium]|nr:hypothetical protein [Acidimicrobiia bacterium]
MGRRPDAARPHPRLCAGRRPDPPLDARLPGVRGTRRSGGREPRATRSDDVSGKPSHTAHPSHHRPFMGSDRLHRRSETVDCAEQRHTRRDLVVGSVRWWRASPRSWSRAPDPYRPLRHHSRPGRVVKRRSAAEGVSSLADHSIGLILDHQAPSGAYPAAPHYPTYRYSWIRDGAFIAYAMDLHGQHHSAQAFHRWVARTVARHAHKVDLLEARPDDRSPAESDRLQVLDDQYVLHTRYTLDGQEAGQEWGNFQPDGYGYWLTALSHHLKVTNGSVDEYREAIATVARYLGLTWDLPCYDCWEEYPTRRHSTTWAAISAGLRHAAELIDDPSAVALADTIMGQLLEHGTHAHTLTKFINLAEDAPPTRTNPITPPAALAGHERVGKT